MRLAAAATLMAVSMVACGDGGPAGTGRSGTGSPASSATGAPVASTTSPSTTEASPTPDLTDAAQGCIDVFVRFLVDIEDVVTGFDFARATLFDYRDFSLALAPAGRRLSERIEGMRCAEPGGAPREDLIPLIMDTAEREAPGSVPYLELTLELSKLPVAASCTKDIATLRRYVQAGGTVSDLPVAERFHAFSLAASIDFTCSLQTAGAFLYRDDVARFLEID